jgi:serine/threonine protein phosphatase PrpC
MLTVVQAGVTLRALFSRVDAAVLAKCRGAEPKWKDGSTAACAVLVGSWLHVAAVGDTRAGVPGAEKGRVDTSRSRVEQQCFSGRDIRRLY